MAPRGQVKLYPEGHFEIYVGDAFERVIADQLDFLEKNLRPVTMQNAPRDEEEPGN
jgi:hypothetical protein